jgi:hypothetical protein
MPSIELTGLPALGRAPVGSDTVPVGGRTVTLSAIFAALGGGSLVVQRITGYPATIDDETDVVVLDDDAEGDVTMPTITEGKELLILTQYDGVLVTLRPQDEATYINGSSSELIDTTYFRERAHVVCAVNFEGNVQWAMGHTEGALTSSIVPALLDALNSITELYTNLGDTAATLSDTITRVEQLESGIVPGANIHNTTTAGPHSILAGETLVRQAYAGAMTYNLPAATVGAQIDIVKATNNAGAITVARSGSDTIHGSASNYALDGSDYVYTGADKYRRRWTLTCFVAGDWTVS